MNKPRVIIIALLMFVVVVAFSAFSVEGRASIRSVSARAHDLQIGLPTPTPTIPYTPEAFIRVEMNALSREGAADRAITCDQGQGRLLYGCTAFCFDPDVDNNPENPICNKEQRLSYPYGDDSAPLIGIENDYLPDVLSQEMGTDFEDITLQAGAITMRSYVLFLFEWLPDHTINNSTQYQAFIPYKFNTLNSAFPSSTCGLPSPLINGDQQRFCDALAPRYYISSIEKGDYPAQANHFSDVPYRTEDASYDHPALVGVEDPISTEEEPCVAKQESVNTYGLSQKGANRWARGNRCGIDTPGEPWSVQWTTAEQILFHYFTRVHLRDADKDKQILSTDWRWNPLKIDWGTADNQPPVMNAGSSHSFEIQVQNTGIEAWDCGVIGNIPGPLLNYRLRYRWLDGSSVIDTGSGGSVCDLLPGNSKTDMLYLQVPSGLSGIYTLQLDMYEASEDFWFSDGGWPPYNVNVQIISQPPSPTPTSCGFDGC